MSHSKSIFLAALLFFMLAFLTTSSAQDVGDYRSAGSGNWTDAGNWEVFNGTNWVAATTYPGQIGGTNLVTIQNGNTISLGSTIPNPIAGLIVGDGTGGTDTLEIDNDAELDTPYIDIQAGGFAIWTASSITLNLPAGAAFIISGGTLDDGKPCSASKRLRIGSVIYSTCNGGAGADYSFEDLQNAGGSLSVSPDSNSPVCEGTDLNLYANPSGAGSSGATFSWSATGPGGYSFSSTDENPVVSGLAAGSYSFTVVITDSSGYSSSGTTAVEITAGASIALQPANQQGVPGATSTFEVSASGAANFQWEVSTDGGSNFTSISDGPKYTGSQTDQLQVFGLQPSDSGNLYRVVIQASNPGCPSITSSTAELTVSSGTVITNRKITLRVNN